jgi:hypothetical protein
MRTKRQDGIISLLQSGPMLQSEILHSIQDQFHTKNAARVSITLSLQKLEKEGRVRKEKVVNQGSGGIQANRWYIIK